MAACKPTIYVKISSMTESKTERERLQEENTALVKQLYAAFAAQNIPALLPLLSQEVDWLFYGPDTIPFAGSYYGHQQVELFFTKALETTEFVVFEPREFIAGSNTILVQGFERGRVKSTGRMWETEWAHVFTVENGQIVKMREYYDTAVIAEAFSSE
jgi:ketosteroid isomerase-like protein